MDIYSSERKSGLIIFVIQKHNMNGDRQEAEAAMKHFEAVLNEATGVESRQGSTNDNEHVSFLGKEVSVAKPYSDNGFAQGYAPAQETKKCIKIEFKSQDARDTVLKGLSIFGSSKVQLEGDKSAIFDVQYDSKSKNNINTSYSR